MIAQAKPHPSDSMSLPEPLPDPEPGSFFDRNRAAYLRHLRFDAWSKTPEGAAEIAASRERLAAEEREREERQRAAALLNALDDRHIPGEVSIREIALTDRPHKTDALRAFREALRWRMQRSRPGVGCAGLVRVVAGPPGTGKSCGLAWVVARHPESALYATAAQIGATPRNGWSANEEAWQGWLSVDLLGIDEAGCEKGDPGPIAFLLAERFNAGRATFVTCNLSRKDFHARYPDERLADRMLNGQGDAGAATGLPWFVNVAGKSLRNPAERAALTGTEGR